MSARAFFPKLLVALLLALGACTPAKRQAMDRCSTQVLSQHTRQAGETDEEFADSLDEPLAACMKTAGYAFAPNGEECDGNHASPACYDVPHPNKTQRALLHYLFH